jgi:rod shape determining protein RodA
MEMNKKNGILANADLLCIGLYLFLIVAGWINIYAAVFNEEHRNIFDFTQRYGKQMIWIAAAFIIAIIVLSLDVKFFSFFAYVVYGLAIFLLLAVIFMGKEVNGSRSWLGFGGILIQPSEFCKVATCLALSKYLSSFNLKIHNIKTLAIIGFIMLLPPLLILMQPDTGSAIVYLSFFLVLYREGLSGGVLFFGVLIIGLFFLSLLVNSIAILISLLILGHIVYLIVSEKKKFGLFAILATSLIFGIVWMVDRFAHRHISLYYLFMIAAIFSALLFAAVIWIYKIKRAWIILLIMIGSIGFTYSVGYFFNKVLEDHQRHRVNIMLGLETDPLGYEYNVNQSKIAIGSGGLTGKGFLKGTQTKFNFVPEQSTDFIFCTVGEEYGFAGSALVVLAFLGLLIRIIFLAERQRSVFSRVYGYGVASILFFHLALNVGMTIGLMPVIGIPLPFFSYGGSSLWSFTLLLFGFIRMDASRYELLR